MAIDFDFGAKNTKFRGSYGLPVLPDFTPKPEDWEKAGVYIVSAIKSRTESGRGVDGAPFAAYSPQYAKRKGGSLVNLRGPGPGPHMVDALTSRVQTQAGTSSLEVGVFGNERHAIVAASINEGSKRVVKTKGKGKKQGSTSVSTPARYFLGLTDEELTHATDIVVESIKERASNGKG